MLLRLHRPSAAPPPPLPLFTLQTYASKTSAAAKVIQAPQDLCRSPARRNSIDEHVTLTLRHAGSVFVEVGTGPASPTGAPSKARWLQASRVHNPAARSAWLLPERRPLRRRRFKHPLGPNQLLASLFQYLHVPAKRSLCGCGGHRQQGCRASWKSARINVRLLRDGAHLCFQDVCQSGE